MTVEAKHYQVAEVITEIRRILVFAQHYDMFVYLSKRTIKMVKGNQVFQTVHIVHITEQHENGLKDNQAYKSEHYILIRLQIYIHTRTCVVYTVVYRSCYLLNVCMHVFYVCMCMSGWWLYLTMLLLLQL